MSAFARPQHIGSTAVGRDAEEDKDGKQIGESTAAIFDSKEAVAMPAAAQTQQAQAAPRRLPALKDEEGGDALGDRQPA